MKISVIIVAYINSEVLVKCLKSIEKYNDIGECLEIIIVDNSPAEKRVEKAIIENGCKFTKYIPADNKGFGAGNNIGASHATGNILAFLNPDIILIQPIFSKVQKHFESNTNLALLGGKLLYEDLSSAFSFYYDYKIGLIYKWSLKLWNKLNIFNHRSMFISGANLFIRSEIFEEAGKFDENIFMYYEETDLTRRIRKSSKQEIKFDKNLKMIHLERKGSPISPKMVDYEISSSIYYGKKYGLDYKKKLKFELQYLNIKIFIYKLINKSRVHSLETIADEYKKTIQALS